MSTRMIKTGLAFCAIAALGTGLILIDDPSNWWSWLTVVSLAVAAVSLSSMLVQAKAGHDGRP